MNSTTAAPLVEHAPPPPPEGTREPGAFARWSGGWRISLRMARRDIAAHRWRSALIALMVGLPVLVMIGGLSLVRTHEITPVEALPAQMGSAQAVLEFRLDRQFRNLGGVDDILVCDTITSPNVFSPTWHGVLPPQMCPGTPPAPPALPVPELADDADLQQAQQALEWLTDARLVPVNRSGREVVVGRRAMMIDQLAVDATDPAARGMVTLTSGRWAQRPGEYVVTQAGIAYGMPSSGTVRMTATRVPRTDGVFTPPPEPADPTAPPALETGTIVGTATAPPDSVGTIVGLVTVPPTTPDGTAFLVDRSTTVTASDVQELNRHGIYVRSRAVVLDPESLPNDHAIALADNRLVVTTALLCLTLLVEACLLAGPAFAVIAQRQRRSLALAAANGATRAQLRRTLLAQALVLGAAAAVAGLALGILGGWAAVRVIQRVRPTAQFGPFEVPILETALVLGFAVLAAVVSALIPARGLTRLDVVTALRGDVVSPTAHRGVPVVGIALFVAGSLALWFLVNWQAYDFYAWQTLGIVVSGGAVVVGALLLTPMILRLIGRAARGLPASVRMATRDASRQRGRSVPTVAAVMAAGVVLSGLGIAAATTETAGRTAYRPSAPVGVAYFPTGSSSTSRTGPSGPQATRSAIEAALPGARVHFGTNLRFPTDENQFDQSGRPLSPVRTLVAVPTGCTATQVLDASPEFRGWPSTPREDERCVAPWATPFAEALTGSIAVLEPGDAAQLFGLPQAARQTLQDGGVVVGQANWVSDGRLALAVGPTLGEDDTGLRRLTAAPQTRSVPAAVAQLGPLMNGTPAVVMAPALAQSFGATTGPTWGYVQGPDGAVTPAQQEAIADALGLWLYDSVNVERGYQSPYRLIMTVTFIAVVLLTLIATVAATALSMGEARRDLATLAAVGAPDRVRRSLAAVQAGVLALVGMLLGLAVGAVPGTFFALLTSRRLLPSGEWLPGFVEVPWLPIVAALVLTPLLAAGTAALFVRGRPDLTRRTA